MPDDNVIPFPAGGREGNLSGLLSIIAEAATYANDAYVGMYASLRKLNASRSLLITMGGRIPIAKRTDATVVNAIGMLESTITQVNVLADLIQKYENTLKGV